MRGATVLLAAGLTSAAFATIDYTVKPVPDALEITVAFQAQGPTHVKMPNWAPGSYNLRDYAASVSELTASGASGSLGVTKVGTNGWSFDASGPVKVTYRVPATLSDGTIHYSGPSTYLYVDKRISEDCRLTLDVPKAYRVAVGLNPIGRTDRVYRADDYDVLADNPVTMGAFLMDTYTVLGKPHFIALRGAPKSDVNRRRLKDVCKRITEIQADYFGGLPYDRYVWHFAVTDRPDGAGGLEHLSSTQISLASGVGPRAVSVISHEFFHLWNVKRIRSTPLGPFNYEELPQTGSLWWLEGVTDYFAHTLLPRYGMWTKEELYKDVVDNVRSVRRNPERLNISPFDASYRVREASNGRGNSRGLGVSYYDTGWVVGMILDLAIIDESNGKESLDSIEHDLWASHRRDPSRGFDDARIGRLAALYGGPKVAQLYQEIVMKAGELPVEAALARAGLELGTAETKTVALPFVLAPNLQAGTAIIATRDTSAPEEAKAGLRVVRIGRTSLQGKSFRAISDATTAATAKLRVGSPVEVVVEDEKGTRSTFNVTPMERTATVQRVVEIDNPTKRQLEVRRLWTSKRRPGSAPR